MVECGVNVQDVPGEQIVCQVGYARVPVIRIYGGVSGVEWGKLGQIGAPLGTTDD
jgi:hypothetical protein